MSLHLSLDLPPSLVARLEALADSNASSLDQVATLLLTAVLDEQSDWVTGEEGSPLSLVPALSASPPDEAPALLMRGCVRGGTTAR